MQGDREARNLLTNGLFEHDEVMPEIASATAVLRRYGNAEQTALARLVPERSLDFAVSQPFRHALLRCVLIVEARHRILERPNLIVRHEARRGHIQHAHDTLNATLR